MTIEIPAAPTSIADCVALLTTGGASYTRPSLDWLIANLPPAEIPGAKQARAEFLEGMAIFEVVCGVAPGTFVTASTPPIPITGIPDIVTIMTVGGNDYVKPAVLWLEANTTRFGRLMKLGHNRLDKCGYAMEELCGVPDGTFGAGGGGPKGGG